jgi:hypothetical protein
MFGADLACVNSSCVELTSSDGAVVDDTGADGGAQCSTNAECIDRASGAPAICDRVSHTCARVDMNGVCLPQILPSTAELRNDNVALFAAFVPVVGAAPLAQPIALSYALALKEIQKAGGLPGGTGGPRRPVAMVLCGSEPDIVEQGVRHVVQDLHVPGLVSLFSQADMARFVQDITVPAGIFTVNPDVTTEALKYTDVKQLVWHMLGTPEDVALAYRPLMTRSEKYALTRRGDAGPIKVALVSTTSSTDTSIASVIRQGPIIRSGDAGGSRDLSKAIAFNGGKSADANGANFKFVQLPAVELGGQPNFAQTVDELAAFRPDVVIAITAEEVNSLALPLEQKLRTDAPTKPLPVWLLSPRNARKSAVLAYLASDQLEVSNDKRKRFLGIQYAGAAEAAEKNAWLERMKLEYPAADPASYSASENYYDAVYWLAYGLYAAGPGAATNGTSLKEGIRKLLTGPRVHPGSTDSIAEAFRLMSIEETMFTGALGPPDIDKEYGAWRSVGSVYCYTPSGSSVAPKYDVLRYDRNTGALGGTFDCFIGF